MNALETLTTIVDGFRNHRIAFTGGKGFLGKNLGRILHKSLAAVVELEGDVCVPATFSGDYDILFHLAAADPNRFAKEPGKAWNINLVGLINALEACRRSGARLIFPSTGAVKELCQSNTKSPLDPRGLYAESKRLGENLCQSYQLYLNTNVTVLRLFNVYGPGQQSPYLISDLLEKLKKGLPLTVNAPGAKRDFVHVEDVLRGFILSAGTSIGFGPFDLGGGVLITARQVLVAIERVLQRPLEPTYGKIIDLLVPVAADIEPAMNYFGWAPIISLEKGLEDLLGVSSLQCRDNPLSHQ